MTAALLTVLALLALGWRGGGALPIAQAGRWPPPGWQVVQCDVGQGSATVLAAAPGHAVLVDAGPLPDAADRCLRRLRVRVLDLLVLTHFHADHVGGLPGALHGRAVRRLLVSPLPLPATGAAAVRRLAAAHGLVPEIAGAGTAGSAGPWRWRVLAPGGREVTAAGGARGFAGDGGESSVNDASLVLEARRPGLRVLALGDVETGGQQRLLRTGVTPVDVAVVAHHGSATQVPALYRALAPRAVLIGVGRHNDYGHPAGATLRLLREAVVGRTDEDGDVAVACDGARCAHLRLLRSRGGFAAPP